MKGRRRRIASCAARFAAAVDLKLDVPDDPALDGVDVLLQELSGPDLFGAGKHGAWSPVEVLRIR